MLIDLPLRKSNSCESPFLPDPYRGVGTGCHGFGQQLFKHRYFLPDSTQNEISHQHIRRFGGKQGHQTHSSS